MPCPPKGPKEVGVVQLSVPRKHIGDELFGTYNNKVKNPLYKTAVDVFNRYENQHFSLKQFKTMSCANMVFSGQVKSS